MGRNQEQRSSVKGLAFDLEGTIVDLESLHYAAHIAAAADHGIRLTLDEAVDRLPHFVGGPDEQVASEIADLASTHVLISDLLRAKQSYFDEALEKQSSVRARLGFIAFFTAASEAGLPCAIGSVTERERAQQLIRRAGLAELLAEIPLVGRGDVARPKPAPDVYLMTAHLCGVRAEDQLVVEDSPVGVRAGHAAGSRVLAVPTVQTPEMLRRLEANGAEAVYLSWRDIPLRIICAGGAEAQQRLSHPQPGPRGRRPG